jgi:hypothetical protein
MDAYAVVDTIPVDYHDDRRGATAVPLECDAFSDNAPVADDVDLESVPGEVEDGVKGRGSCSKINGRISMLRRCIVAPQRGKNTRERGWRKHTSF